MPWIQLTTDDFKSTCGRWTITRIPCEVNGVSVDDFSDRDTWILSDGHTPVEAFPYIYDAQRFAEDMMRLGNDLGNS